jgi:ABC-type uncharacterized transport system involved in gliding motility auxiliary subunit
VKQYVSYLGLLGILLLAVGGVIYAVQWEMTTPVAAVIWAGVLLSILFLYVNFSEIKGVFSGRSVKYGANAAIMAAVFIGILVMVALMSIKYKARVDLTATRRYTLSAQTQKILKGLKKEIEVISFYRSDERTRQAMEDILQSYASFTPRFTYWFVDPDRKPGEAEKYGVTSYRTTLVKSGTRQETVSYESEEKLTNAVLKVTRDEVKAIYFLKGHGENAVLSDQKDGYKAVKDSIEKENLAVKELFLIEQGSVPSDCAVLVVSGPKKDLLPDELKKITDYIESGGSVLFMLDPYTVPELAKYLGAYGFQVGNDIIVDTLSKVFGANYLVPVVTAYEKEHPVTEEFSLMTFFPLSRSVTLERDPAKGAYMLASSGNSSWAETDRKALEDGKAEFTEGRDRRGPVGIVAVGAFEAKQGKETRAGDERKVYSKVAVIGDSDFVNNTNINLAGNRDFFLNTVSWLAEEADLISIRKKPAGLTPIILTTAQGRFVFWFGVVIPPSLIAIAGIGFFLKRRSGK